MTTTFDPAHKNAAITLSNNNLTASTTSATFDNLVLSTNPLAAATAARLYVELTGGANSGPGVGLSTQSTNLNSYLGIDSQSIGWLFDGRVLFNNATVATIATYTGAAILCLAFDLGTKKIWFRNGAGNWNNDIPANQNPAIGSQVGGISITTLLSNGAVCFAYDLTSTQSGTVNFGATNFAQAVPVGFWGWDWPIPVPRSRNTSFHRG